MDTNLEYWMRHSDRRAQERGNSFRAHDYLSGRVFRQTQAGLLDVFRGRTASRILDVGCGNGLFTRPLVGDHKVVGVDVSCGMLRLAATNGTLAIRGLAQRLPFADGAFDAACCIEMLQCVTDGDQIVREMARVVRPGGILYLQTINQQSPLRRVLAKLDAEAWRLRAYTLGELYRYTDLPQVAERRVIYNYYPLPMTRATGRPSTLSNLAATSFALVARTR